MKTTKCIFTGLCIFGLLLGVLSCDTSTQQASVNYDAAAQSSRSTLAESAAILDTEKRKIEKASAGGTTAIGVPDGASTISPPYFGPCADYMEKADAAFEKTQRQNGVRLSAERYTYIEADGAKTYRFRFYMSPPRPTVIGFTETAARGCKMSMLTSGDKVYSTP